ncbi:MULTISPECIES: rhodanese-like domain-containing protein [Halobacterium]|uniref:rhodanese-like domain-containing protein n=1 Tax=Halobacterium TaxID=2239 RepID=UPI00073E2C62|nr:MULTISPECIES: rhodanese-like domain-containing protein [Halobacterium]MCG1003906.1 rhodanese-like domain-containing protein [Halobacterium noricense]
MNRRAFLAAGAAGSLAAVSGCLGLFGSSNVNTNMELPADGNPDDGYPPAYGDPDERSVDPSSFPTTTANGETIRLAPIDVAHYWHQRADARFVDARGQKFYEQAHIYGAVNSPAQPGSSGGGISGWANDDRIVCYCGCPHHLSSVRASALQQAGFSNVFVIDEGFVPWRNNGYAMRGTNFDPPQEAKIQGAVDPEYAGEYAWATHEASGQSEAAPIAEDGSFAVHFKFYDLSADAPIHVQTPDFEVTRPLGDLTGAVLTG